MLHEQRFFFLASKAIAFALSRVYGRSPFTGYLTNVINPTGLSRIKLCRASLHFQKPPAFSTYQNEHGRWIPVKVPFEWLSLPNQIRAHSLMTQHCCRVLTGRLSLCSMERITYESQPTARSGTLSRMKLGGTRRMCALGVSEGVEKQCARHIRANVTARAASPRHCHRSSSRVETDALAHPPGVVGRPAGVAVFRHHLNPSQICLRLLVTCREANALSCSCSE